MTEIDTFVDASHAVMPMASNYQVFIESAVKRIFNNILNEKLVIFFTNI